MQTGTGDTESLRKRRSADCDSSYLHTDHCAPAPGLLGGTTSEKLETSQSTWNTRRGVMATKAVAAALAEWKKSKHCT